MAALRGNSSVGRARPCQGRGREFESRFPLQFWTHVQTKPRSRGFVVFSRDRGMNPAVDTSSGRVAEWLCSGLQIRVRRFNSDLGLQFRTLYAGSGFIGTPKPRASGAFFCARSCDMAGRALRWRSRRAERFVILRHGRSIVAGRAPTRSAGFPGRRRRVVSYCCSRGPGPDGEIGRRIGLKIRRPQGHAGSSPAPGTTTRFPIPGTPSRLHARASSPPRSCRQNGEARAPPSASN